MSSKAKGILYIIIAAFGFSMMSVFVHLAGDMPTFQKAFFRNAVTLILVLVIMLRKKISFIPKKGSLPALCGRTIFGTIGLLCNFYAIDHLVLADDRAAANGMDADTLFFLRQWACAAESVPVLHTHL